MKRLWAFILKGKNIFFCSVVFALRTETVKKEHTHFQYALNHVNGEMPLGN